MILSGINFSKSRKTKSSIRPSSKTIKNNNNASTTKNPARLPLWPHSKSNSSPMPSKSKNSTSKSPKNNPNLTMPSKTSISTKNFTKPHTKPSKCTNNKPIPPKKKPNKSGTNSKRTTKIKLPCSNKESPNKTRLTSTKAGSKSVQFS